MVADPGLPSPDVRLDDDEIEPEREVSRHIAALEQGERPVAKP